MNVTKLHKRHSKRCNFSNRRELISTGTIAVCTMTTPDGLTWGTQIYLGTSVAGHISADEARKLRDRLNDVLADHEVTLARRAKLAEGKPSVGHVRLVRYHANHASVCSYAVPTAPKREFESSVGFGENNSGAPFRDAVTECKTWLRDNGYVLKTDCSDLYVKAAI